MTFDLESRALAPIAWTAPDIAYRTTTTAPRSALTDTQRKACVFDGQLFVLEGMPEGETTRRTITTVSLVERRDPTTVVVSLPETSDIGRLICTEGGLVAVLGRTSPNQLSAVPISFEGRAGTPATLDYVGSIYETTGDTSLVYELDRGGIAAEPDVQPLVRLVGLIGGRWEELVGEGRALGDATWISNSGHDLLERRGDSYRGADR